jgi:uncharacterized protein
MLVDTSVLLCCFDGDEPRHDDTVDLFDSGTQRFTHNYVLLESIALAQARRLHRETALKFALNAAVSPNLELVWVDKELHDRGMGLLAAQLDKTYSLCDAVSFLLMRERGIIDALTTDRHFEQAGFRKLLPSA